MVKFMRNVIGVTSTLALLLTLSAHAQQRGMGVAKAPTQRRVALVIGNGTYEDAPLRNPVNDASDMARALTALGFEVIHKENLNQNDMKRAIREFGSKIRGGGVGLFYYAGHGVQVKGVNYLIPVGAKVESEEDVEYEAVDAGFVLAQMEGAGNAVNIVILDACRNNSFARSYRSASRGLALMDAPSGTLIAYATAPNSVASDGDGRNGLYTQEILKFIATPGLRVEEVFKQVRISVRSLTQGRQTPWESSSLTGDFSFAGQVAPKVAGPTLQQAAEANAQSGNNGGSAPQKSAGDDKQKVTLNGVTLEIQSCRAAGTTITCTLSIANESSSDLTFYALNNTQAVSDSGDVYKVTSWQVGGVSGGSLNSYTKTVLVSGVPTKAVFKFERVSSNVSKLSLLRIGFSFNVFAGESRKADFKNIPL
jgi:uncharacterized caspase-like protein